MTYQGQRFNIDLPSEYDVEKGADNGNSGDAPARTLESSAPVKDISERPTKPPAVPCIKTTKNGFPMHKKRLGPSRLTGSEVGSLNSAAQYIERQQGVENNGEYSEKAQKEASQQESIDSENKKKLASMSDAEILTEQKDLVKELSPSLMERLLKRSKADDLTKDPQPTHLSPTNHRFEERKRTTPAQKRNEQTEKAVRFAEDDIVDPPNHDNPSDKLEAVPTRPASDLDHPSFQVPKPQSPREPDPNSPSFFQDLHQKYFASLPADPSKLAWMQPANNDLSYSPDSQFIEIPNLRFNFNGSLITPRQAGDVAVTEGLHHHEDAPSSAGYTVPELARLSRSSVASQRCIAYQTLGRIMYRLGVGEFGGIDEKIPKGLWKCVNDGHVIKTLQEEANKKNGHVSANAYANEALWLWRKGGGQQLRAD